MMRWWLEEEGKRQNWNGVYNGFPNCNFVAGFLE